MNRGVIAAAIAALLVGLGGGFLAARTLPPGFLGVGGAAAPGANEARGPRTTPWSLFGHPRAANAPRRGIPRPEGFTVWRTRLDTSGAQPKACVEMSRPLDAAKSYGDFVLVSPDLGAPPAVSVSRTNPAELCVGGVGFSDRRITLLRGLPGRGSDALAANQDVDFTFGERPPYVGFAGEGVILPRDESDGVGIETVNVSRLAIEVWRVPDRNLVRRNISAPSPTEEGGYADDYSDDSPDSEGRMVWHGEIAVANTADTSGHNRVTTVFPLGAVLHEMQPGGYVIKARDASGGRAAAATSDDEEGDSQTPAQARRWVIFTDMAVIGYRGQGSLDVVVRSLRTARVMSGLRVALVASNGEDLGEGRTDASGHVAFPRALLEGEDASHPRMVMAYGPQGDLAVLDLDRSPVDLSRQNTGGREGDDVLGGRTNTIPIDAYVYSDRGIYRPGETVRMVSMLRDLQARAVHDRKGMVIVRRPSGVEYRRYVFENAPQGVVTTDIVLPQSAPRGRWTAEVMIDGYESAAGDLSFSVEDFAPQRLAVTATADETRPMAAGESRPVSVSARFLYGAPGAALQTQGEARVRVDPNPFPAFEGYSWGDETARYEEKFINLEATVTDGEGHATLTLPSAEIGEAQDPLIAAVTASVFEPGGRPVREGLNVHVRTRPLYIGVKIDGGENGGDTPTMSFQMIGVNAAGQRVAAQAVSYTLITEAWSYDWFQQDGRWQYRRTSRDNVVMRGTVNIAAGDPARFARRLGSGSYRLEITGPDGARTVTRFYAGFGAPASETETPDQVRVSAGTRTWRQGDTVEIAVRSPYAGEAQIAVATDHVISLQTATIGANGLATVRLRTTADWGGGAYVLVTVIQPRDPANTPLPRRALGLTYVPLDPGNRRLTVTIGALPPTLDSKAPVAVPIQVAGMHMGQRARVTIAAVDEGILRLTRQQSPDPVAWYFGKRALSVDYRDDYGRLLDPNLGAPAGINFGGDELGGEGLTVTPIRTVALWSGVVETGLDGRATVRLPAADFNGELRIMAVAWTDEGVGSASRPLVVRAPVVTDLNLPRFLAPGDHATAILELHNVDGQPGAYTADTSSDGGIRAVFHQVFQLIRGQRIAQLIGFQAPTSTGIGHIGYRVTGPGFSAERTYPIQTRLGWGPVTTVYNEPQRPGEAYTPSASMLSPMASGTDVAMQVSYSPFRGFDPGPIALALQRYPYGCTEQTVSVAYPLLYATEVTTNARVAAAVPPALSEAVGKLLDRQTLDGAFGLWRVGDGEADAWLGAYATDFLIEAQRRGAPVPQSAIDRAMNAMREISRPDAYSSVAYRLEYPGWWMSNEAASREATQHMRSRASAYALYVMAKAGRGDLARLRWWHDVQMHNDPSPLARAQVGAALALMGDNARARDSFRQAIAVLGFREPSDWYQSPLRDLAGVVALAYESHLDDIGRSLQSRLENSVRDPDALNTQEQARLLQAAHYMLAAAGPVRITATGAIPQPTSAAGTPRWAVTRPSDAHFTNGGTGVIWRTVTIRGTPRAAPATMGNGITVSKTLYTFTGGAVDLSQVHQGDRVIVLITGVSSQAHSIQLAVNDALPAGFEIETTLGPEDAQSGPFRFLGDLTGADVQESRDDRYVAAMDIAGGGRFAFAYVARAVNPGDFFLPGVEAVDMYHPAIAARTAPSRLVITPAAP